MKEGWSFLTSTLDVQSAMSDMQKMQDGKSDVLAEEQMRDLESDLMGKMLLVRRASELRISFSSLLLFLHRWAGKGPASKSRASFDKPLI